MRANSARRERSQSLGGGVGGFGIIIDGADGIRVAHNIVTGGRGPAIYVDRLDAPTSAEDNVVSPNVANGRFDDGILVGPGSRETLAERNVAFGSGDDGRHHERRLAPPWHILALIER